MRKPRRNGGAPPVLQKKPLHALLGFAIAACTIFAPSTTAYAADTVADSSNTQTASEPVEAGANSGTTQSGDETGGDKADGNAPVADNSQNSSTGDSSTTESTESDTADQPGDSGFQSQANDDSQQQKAAAPQSSNVSVKNVLAKITTKAQAHAQANAVNGDVVLPTSWDSDMKSYFPDEVLRTLVTQEVQKEFAGEDLSDLSAKEILSWVWGVNGVWNLYNDYKKYASAHPGARIKLLNGIQYLTGLTDITASGTSFGELKGVGLQTFAFPGLSESVHIPDLVLDNNNLHIFPRKIFPDIQGNVGNLPTTNRKSIHITQDMYHHTSVTYVRDGKGGKQVEFVGGIYKLSDSVDSLLPLGRAVNDVDPQLLEPIFDQSTDARPDEIGTSYNTVTGLSVGNKTKTGFTITTGGNNASEGEMYRLIHYPLIAVSFDSANNPDKYSFSYGYYLTMNYLSTVKQQSTTKVLGDFKFKKTSEANPNVALKGAVYVVRATNGKYLTGTQQKDGTYLVATDSKTGELITTTDCDKALQPETDDKGEFTVRGVPGSKDGVEYRLTEIKAPSGYARSTGDVSVKVRVAKDLKTKVDGGEGDMAIVTADSVKADASDPDDWVDATVIKRGDQHNPNGTRYDYANSGDALVLKGADGSTDSAEEVKSASDYDGGADLFIKNGGNTVTFSTVATDDSALPADYRLEHQTSTLTDGAKETLLESSDKDALAKVSDHVNTIINEKSMTKTTDYYDVNTVAVYHDTSSADDLNSYIVSDDGTGDQNVQRDKVLPVAVKFNAVKKLLKNGEKEPVKAGEFKFSLEPDAESAKAGAPTLKNATAEVGSDGLATWDALNLTADWWSGVKKDDGVADFTYNMTEVNTGSKKYDYDTSVYKIRIKVSEHEEYGSGVTKGLTVRVYVNGTLKLLTTSADTQKQGWQTPTVKVRSDEDPDATFINTEKVTDFSFTKKDGETGDALEGAVFQLYRYNGDCDAACKAEPLKPLSPGNWEKIDTQTSGTDGKVTFKDLTSDTYRLIESKAPDGYTRPSGQWNVVVDLSQQDKTKQITITAVENGNNPPAFKHEEDGGLSVANYKAKTIPSTGGRGLIAFSLMGAVLVLGGAFVMSKRMLGEEVLES